MVTIITPLHNKASYISETLKSVVSQEYLDWEVLVVENHSVDNGPEIAKKYAAEDNRIRYIEAPTNIRGPGAARNYALQFARGDWVLYLDADDLISPNFLIQIIDFSNKNPECSILASPWRIFNENGYISQLITHEIYGKSKNDLLTYSFARVPWHIGSALVKRSLLNQCSWVESMDNLIAEDGVFWFQLIINARVGWSDIDGALYRIGLPHSRGNSSDSLKWALAIQETININDKCMHKNGLKITIQQCIACLDIFEDRYWISYRTKSTEAADICMKNAIKWLKKIKSLKSSILMRKAIGIKNSIILEKFFHRLFNKAKIERVLVFPQNPIDKSRVK